MTGRVELTDFEIDVSERRRFRGPRHLVSGADWMPGTARAPVSLSHHNYEN